LCLLKDISGITFEEDCMPVFAQAPENLSHERSNMNSRTIRALVIGLIFHLFTSASMAAITLNQEGIVARKNSPSASDSASETLNEVEGISATMSRYYHPTQGASSHDLVRHALASNAEMAAARIDIERARARLSQAGLRPNPSIDFEQTTDKFTGSTGERETSISFALPLDINGQRQRRINLAQAELEASEAEVADRERRLIAEVRAAYAESLAAIRDLQAIEGLNSLDIQTARIIEARVTEGESAPLELNLLRAEVDRLKSRRALVEGRLQASLLRLKTLTGFPPDNPLQLREDLTAPVSGPPSSLDAAIDNAMRTRPDLRLARLGEKVAEAGLQLIRAQGRPDVTAFTRYSQNTDVFDDTPIGVLRDKDKLLTFGVSISIPLFNRNQGTKAEAAAAIAQAKRRREFAEQLVKSEVASAYARYQASQAALAIFEQGVLARSTQNIQSIRRAYELGAFRLTELLTEQRRLLDSQREYTEALTERYKAITDLLSAIGTPLNPITN
jgi:cobalt-zinc-cadmium efflux system outer membrane protein